MPRYAPQSLPQKNPSEAYAAPTTCSIVTEAAALGRSIRQEQGMQGVRAFVAAMRPFLRPQELMELSQAMGVPCPPPDPEPAFCPPPPPPPPAAPPPHQQTAFNQPNMAQMMQMLGQLNGMGGVMGGGQNGGINPMMLTQLMNMFNQKR